MKPIKDLKPKRIVPGVEGYYAHGDLHTLGYVILKKGSLVPLHHHVHEQITFILEGQLDMEIDGQQYSLTQGTFHVIPSTVPHSAVAVTDVVAIDTFSPVREDYKDVETLAFSLQNQND